MFFKLHVYAHCMLCPFFTFSRNSTHMNHQCNGAWTVLRNSCGRDVRSMSTNQTKTICFPFDHKFPEDWPRAMVNANLMMSPPALGRGPRWAQFFFCSRDCCLCAMHQSVKELRHARRQREQETNQKPKAKPNQKTTKNKTHTKTKHHKTTNPFAAGETCETGET